MGQRGIGILSTKAIEQSVNPHLGGSIVVGLENQINYKNILIKYVL